MSRLIAFGCSITWGESLPDVLYVRKGFEERLPSPSKYAWPNILSKKLGRKCLNLGENAISNKQIWHNILQTDFQKDDIVIVLWTYFHRTCFFSEDGIRYIIPSWADKKHKRSPEEYRFNKIYYNTFFFNENLNTESFLCIDHASKFLDEKGIKNYHFTFSRDSKLSPLPLNNIEQPKWFKTNLQSVEFINDLASDKHHPSFKAHGDFANKIYKLIGTNLPTSM